MSALTELELFHQFQKGLLEQGHKDLSPEEVLRLWRARQSECEETVEAVREGLEDVRAGRVQPLAEFDEEFRSKHNIRHDA
jgi:hypothetical protein